MSKLKEGFREKEEKVFVPRWKRILNLPMNEWLWSLEAVRNPDGTEDLPYRFQRWQIQWSDEDDRNHVLKKPVYFSVQSQKNPGVYKEFLIDFIRKIKDGTTCSLMGNKKVEKEV